MKNKLLKTAAALAASVLAVGAFGEFPLSLSHAERATDPRSALSVLEQKYGTDVSSLRFEQKVPVAYGSVYRFTGDRDVRLAVDETGVPLSVTYDEPAPAPEETARPAVAVTLPQTDESGNEVEVSVEFEKGVYTLADELRNIYVYHAHNGTGQFPTDELRYHNTTGVFDDGIAVTSYLNMVKVYDFYANGGVGVPLRGVDGSNDEIPGNYKENNESRVFLFVHYGYNEQNAHGWYDKYYNAAMVGVGDGNPDAYFYRLGRATDVMAHEYQHTITHFNVDFVQMNESGAIDEAISDMLGALAEGHELTDERFWLMGEDAVAKNDLGVRSIKEPANGYCSSFNDLYPACHEMHDHNQAGCDFGGVHYNSTVLTHAQYKMWKAFPAFFTKERIGKLWYSVIPLLGRDADFGEFKSALLTTAENLGFNEIALDVMRESFLDGEVGTAHCVRFLDEDGSLLGEAYVKHGGKAEFPGGTPSREADAQYEYAFSGWSEEFSSVTEDMTVTALYTRTLRNYLVLFTDENGAILKRETVPYGGSATPPDPPVKADDAQFEYVFTGWQEGYEHVTGDMTVAAVFEEKPKRYSARFFSDGEIYLESEYEYGAAVPFPTPQKEGYKFVGWYLDEGLTERAETFTAVRSADFYAKWEKEKNGCSSVLAVPVLPLLLFPLLKKRGH